MSKIKEKISKATRNLPSEYRQALNNFDTNKTVKEIASSHDLSDEEQSQLDREVTYLLLHIQDTTEFVTRLENKLNWHEEKVADITESVTQKIIRPLEKKIDDDTNENTESLKVPTPPSSSDGPPTPNYGGGSDPYREPTD